MGYDFGMANEAQKKAIVHKDGPLLLLAGPGTGKNFTLVNRILYLILEHKVSPGNILVCTQTEAAARELMDGIAGESERYGVTIDVSAMYLGTCPAICRRILMEYADDPKDFHPDYELLDEKKQLDTVNANLEFFYEKFGRRAALGGDLIELRSREEKDWIPKTICKLVNRFHGDLVDSLRIPDGVEEDKVLSDSAAYVGKLLQVYEEFCQEKGFYDEVSIQKKCYEFLQQEEAAERIREKIQYVIMDDYQDARYVQEQLMLSIAGEEKNICVAGCDDLALSREKGGNVRHILEFPQKMREEGAETEIVTLTVNYRSDPKIVDLCNKWMDSSYRFHWQDGEKLYRYPKTIRAVDGKEARQSSLWKISGYDFPQRICDYIKRLKVNGKITDYNQVVVLAHSVSTFLNEANFKLFQCFEDNNLPLFSPESNEFSGADYMILSKLQKESGSDVLTAPSGRVLFMTLKQAVGRKFPVVIVLLANAIQQEEPGVLLTRRVEDAIHQPSYEPLPAITNMDFYRSFYAAFSCAQDRLVLVDRAYKLDGCIIYEKSHESFDELLKAVPGSVREQL